MTSDGRALPAAASDGVPCRPYKIGQHAAALSRILLRRLVAAAVIAAVLTAATTFVLALVLVGDGSLRPADLGLVRLIGSPIGLGLVLVAVDYLLIRGRIARPVSILTWAGKRDAAQLRATTGLARATDRAAAAQWLAAHPMPVVEDPAVTASRVHLQVLVGELGEARTTVAALPDDSPTDALWKALLSGQVDLAAGQPFDADDLRVRVERERDPETRAFMAVEVAALVAQARWTCGGDHLGPVEWAVPYVAGRDSGTLLRGYWLPMTALVLIVSLLLGVVFPTTI